MRVETRASKRVQDQVPREGGSFEVGRHLIRLRCLEGRWTATVDGVTAADWHRSQAEAWAAGVHEADRLDREAAAPAPGPAELAPFSRVAGTGTG
jgi:hypothetical protein